jgi:hypothetical protein
MAGREEPCRLHFLVSAASAAKIVECLRGCRGSLRWIGSASCSLSELDHQVRHFVDEALLGHCSSAVRIERAPHGADPCRFEDRGRIQCLECLCELGLGNRTCPAGVDAVLKSRHFFLWRHGGAGARYSVWHPSIPDS